MFLQVMSRRMLGFGLMVLAGMLGAGSAEAQDIRYFVNQSTGLFEITATATGGKFVVAPTGEKIVVNKVSIPVQGRTDRAQRGETVVTQITGSGSATVSVVYTTEAGAKKTIFAGPASLPLVVPQTVSLSSNLDNLVVSATQGAKTVSRRLPIGSR
ncbi:MAG: hypothetical protein WCJ31_10925 [Planctomycetia bacterium]|jgi:hypothetical protein